MQFIPSTSPSARSANRFTNVYIFSIPVELAFFALWMHFRLGHLWLLRDLIYVMGSAVAAYVLYQAFYWREVPALFLKSENFAITGKTYRGLGAMLMGVIYLLIAFAVPMMVSGLR